MPSPGTNNYLRRDSKGPSGITVDLTVTPPGGSAGQIWAGEMIYLSASQKAASLNSAGTANANVANFIGVSIDNYPLLVAQGVSEGAATGEIPAIAFRTAGEFLFKTTAADTYNVGDVVYLGADGMTVQKTASGTSIGRVSADQTTSPSVAQGASISSPVAGGAGVWVAVTIAPAIVL